MNIYKTSLDHFICSVYTAITKFGLSRSQIGGCFPTVSILMPMFQVSELWGMTNKLENCHRVSSLWSTLSFLILIFFRFIFTFVLHVLIFCLHVHMCITRMPGTRGGQKTASEPRNWRHRQPWLTMWVLWKGPLKKQPVLLTDGSSIQLCLQTLVINVLKCSPIC